MASSEDGTVDSGRSWPGVCQSRDEKHAKRQREGKEDEELSMSSSKRNKPNSTSMTFSLPECITSSNPPPSRSLFASAQPGIDISPVSKDSSNFTFKLRHLDSPCARTSPVKDQGADVPEEKGPQAGEEDLVVAEQTNTDEHAHSEDEVSWSLGDLVSGEHTPLTTEAESSTTADGQGLGLKFGLSHDSPSLFGGAERPGITLQQISSGSLTGRKFSLEHATFNPPTKSEASETESDTLACSSSSGQAENLHKAAPVESTPRSKSQLIAGSFHDNSTGKTPAPTAHSEKLSPQPQAKDEELPSSPSQTTGRNPFLSSLPDRVRARSPLTYTAESAPSPVQTGVLEDKSEANVAESKPVAHSSPEEQIGSVATAALVESSSRSESHLCDGRHPPFHSHHDFATKTPSTHSVSELQQQPNAVNKAKLSPTTDSNPLPSLPVQVRPKSPLIENSASPAQSNVSECQLKPPHASDACTRLSLPEVCHDPLRDNPQSSEHVEQNPPALPAPTTAVVTVPPSHALPYQNLPAIVESPLANQLIEPCTTSNTVPVSLLPPTLPATVILRRINFSFLPAFCDSEVVSRICEICQACGINISIFTYTNGMVDFDVFASEVNEVFRSCTAQKNLPIIRDFYQQLSVARPSVKWEFFDTTSDAAQWEPLSAEVNAYLCQQCSEGRATFELPGPEENYHVDLSLMTVTGELTGHTGLLQSLKPIWNFFQDDDFGFIPFDESVNQQIEDAMLFGSATHLIIDDGHCTIDFESGEKPLLLYIDNESKEICRLERNPPLPSSVVHEFMVQFSGDVGTIERAIEAVKNELEIQIHEKDVDVSSVHPTFRCLLYQMARQYCVEATMSTLETIHLQGTGHLYLEKVLLQLERTCFDVQRKVLEHATLHTHTPRDWEPQKEDKALVLVGRESSEWEHVHNLMKKTIPSVQLLKLERVQSVDLWGRFSFFKSRMEANKEDLNEKDLFHGTRAVVPTEIINDKKGFDFRCARDGMWGAGIYFAAKASYSDGNYAYKVPGEDCKQLLLARVLTGKAKDLAPDRTLRKPPAGYDTVTGKTNGSRVYVVYDHEKAYPAYLITYTT